MQLFITPTYSDLILPIMHLKLQLRDSPRLMPPCARSATCCALRLCMCCVSRLFSHHGPEDEGRPRRGRQCLNANLIRTTVLFFLESEVRLVCLACNVFPPDVSHESYYSMSGSVLIYIVYVIAS